MTSTGNQGMDALADAIAERVAEKVMAKREPEVAPRLLSINQAARYLSRTREAVRRLIRNGVLQTVRMDDRVFLDIRDLDRVIEAAKKR